MTLKTILLRTLPLSLLTSPLMAQDIGKLFVLSEDVRDVVLKMPETQDLQSGKYLLTQREADLVKNLSAMDESMNSFLNNEQKIDCYTQQGTAAKILNNRIPYRDFNLYFTMTGSTNRLNSNSLGVLTTNDYESYLFDRMSAGYSGASSFYTFSQLEQAFKNAYPNVNYDSLGFSEKENYLSNYLSQLYGTKPPAGALVQVLAYNSMVSDGSNWKKYLGEAKGLLTTDQKVTLVSEFGNKFGSLYNYARADNGGDDTFVTMEKLLYSAKTGIDGGVCRGSNSNAPRTRLQQQLYSLL